MSIKNGIPVIAQAFSFFPRVDPHTKQWNDRRRSGIHNTSHMNYCFYVVYLFIYKLISFGSEVLLNTNFDVSQKSVMQV